MRARVGPSTHRVDNGVTQIEASLEPKVALVTGGAKRIGAAIVCALHEAGMRVAIHFRNSVHEAEHLRDRLNDQRSDSASSFNADLRDVQQIGRLIENVQAAHGRLDLVVNNAATFFPTPIGSVSVEHWQALLGPNLQAPFFLAQSAAPELARNEGCIVNIVDIYARRPLAHHSVYSISKAGLVMLTRSLARELAPKVRVNAIAPGAILWPEEGLDEATRARVIERTPLERLGDPSEIGKAVLFLVRDARFMTGEIITLDGGRMIGL